MTSWTSRIDALPPFPDCGGSPCLYGNRGGMRTNGGCRCHAELRTAERIKVERGIHALRARLALAAERMKEPHTLDCMGGSPWARDGVWSLHECDCGKDADLLRILDGKR